MSERGASKGIKNISEGRSDVGEGGQPIKGVILRPQVTAGADFHVESWEQK